MKPPGDEATVNVEEVSRLANVDLEVFSRVPLDGLAAAFGKRVTVRYVGKWGARHAVCLGVAGSGYRANADRLIRRFVAPVKALPKPARTLWDGAQRRDFNLGIDAGVSPAALKSRSNRKRWRRSPA